ncbi:MAG: 16S rRNA (guanine(527)-N(7))-methyltransferase RsmG [Gammaproteobacteria bacterium]|nr:16S rRNA (guanine(527)-N(7))-methyltransferase RsmG [Gammaproteobacteria bacterium]
MALYNKGRRRKNEYTVDNGAPVYDDLEDRVTSALQEAGHKANPQMISDLAEYLRLMAQWTRAYNLTSVRDPVQMISRHLMDSLSIMPYLKGQYFLDVGTGAGLPGIPLAILNPDLEFTLLDSNGKKVRFLHQVVRDLGLDNVVVEKERAEDFYPGIEFDGILSRAFSSIRENILNTYHLCAPGGEFLAMKGIYPAAELTDLPEGFEVVEVHHLDVPGLEGERTLVRIKAKAK